MKMQFIDFNDYLDFYIDTIRRKGRAFQPTTSKGGPFIKILKDEAEKTLAEEIIVEEHFNEFNKFDGYVFRISYIPRPTL